MLSSIAIDVTNYCNLDCLHCLRDKQSPRAHMEIELFELVLKEITSVGIQHASLTGGEIALHPELDQMFDLFVEHKVRFNFVSNAYLFNEKILPLLNSKVRKQLTDVCFSLDGATAASHEIIRGKSDSFQRTKDAIAVCRQKGIPVVVKSIIHTENIHELTDLAFLCASMDVQSLSFIILTPTPALIENNLIPSAKQYSQTVKNLKGKVIPAFSLPIDIEGFQDSSSRVSYCNPARGLAIDHEGNFIFCCNLSHPTAGDKPDKFGKEFIGNIKEIGIEQAILNHYELLGWFMEKMIKSDSLKNQKAHCSNCFDLFGKMKWVK